MLLRRSSALKDLFNLAKIMASTLLISLNMICVLIVVFEGIKILVFVALVKRFLNSVAVL